MKQASSDRAGSAMSRRRFLRIVAMAGAGIALPLAYRRAVARVSETQILMGTVVNLTIVTRVGQQKVAEQAIAACLAEMARLEGLLSRFKADSELTRLNLDGELEAASPALLAILRQSRVISQLSDGAFDITVEPVLDLFRRAHSRQLAMPTPQAIAAALARVGWERIRISDSRVWFAEPGMAITLDGVAKGYIVDAGVAELRARGFCNLLVEAGGDLLAAGSRAGVQPWQLGIQGPPARGEVVARFTLSDRAAATSGDYEHPFTADRRLHHVIDPRTGVSPLTLASATVLAPTVCLADALSTAVMVLGPDQGLPFLKHFPACEAHLIAKNHHPFSLRASA